MCCGVGCGSLLVLRECRYVLWSGIWFIISTQGMLGCVVEWDVVHYWYSGNVRMCCGVG